MSKPPIEWQIDVLFGWLSALECAVTALMQAHPDKDGLEAHFDMQLDAIRTMMLNDTRSDLAIEAFEGTAQEIKDFMFHRRSTSEYSAHLVRKELEKRLKD